MLSKYKKRDKQKLRNAYDKFNKKAKQAKANAKAQTDAQTYVNVIENFTMSSFHNFAH